MEKKPIRTILLVVVVLSLVVCAFGGGFLTGKVVPLFDTNAAAPDVQETSPTAESQGGTPADLTYCALWHSSQSWLIPLPSFVLCSSSWHRKHPPPSSPWPM